MAYWRPELKIIKKINKGFTLVEVVLAIAIIALIAVSFLPLFSFSYINLLGTEQLTQNIFNDQQLVENEIDSHRFSSVPNPNTNYKSAFGVSVPVHLINVNTSNSGKVRVYLPKQSQTPRVPVLENAPLLLVRNSNNVTINPQPLKFNLLTASYNLFVSEVPISSGTKEDYLMSVYRWYLSDEISNSQSAGESTNEYVVAKEWNEAKSQITYSQALTMGFIPNIKEYTNPNTGLKELYNVLDFKTFKTAYSYNTEQMINVFGNRYVRYGVTPYSIAGRIGEERLSNTVYVEAPRIEIVSAKFDSVHNSIAILFNLDIEDSFNPSLIKLNDEIGVPNSIRRDTNNHKLIILDFPNPLNKTSVVNGNLLLRGSVASKDYGAITIWYGGNPNAEFPITP